MTNTCTNITVTLDSASWTSELFAHKILADVETTCPVEVDGCTAELTVIGAGLDEVIDALDAHPAVISYVLE